MKKPFRIAAIATAYYAISHADVMVTRWLKPFPKDPEWGWPASPDGPETEIVSLYIHPNAERPEGHGHFNIGPRVAREHGVPIFDSIAGALTLGGDSLAVDGVLFIGEHGDFPLNDLGQKLYPRFEYWNEIVEVMRASGRMVPVFFDKHLSYDDEKAWAIYNSSRELGIPLMAGSSLSHCELDPALPQGTTPAEVASVFFCGAEVYGFHILEVVQRIIESRPGGENGVRRVMALRGPQVWDAIDSGTLSELLLLAAVEAADDTRPGDLRQNCGRAAEKSGAALPIAFLVEHLDGFRTTHYFLEGHINDFALAVKFEDGRIYGARVAGGDASNVYAHFALLNRNIEAFFLRGEVTAPLERTMLATLTINACMRATRTPGEWVEVGRTVSY